jgi:hypothetical protein
MVSFFASWKITPAIHWIKGWVGLRVALDMVAKRISPGLPKI